MKKKKKIDKTFFLSDINAYCRRYLLSALNLLTESPKILHITQRNFFNLCCIQRDQ